ncbi:peptidoglycan D,D-transpeptidase FtsI family protein [Bacillus sp. CGMCC 1.16607]|uniref:peptidoglycan D,D-transpeptidase FtsI family protein n=1 Tax=Bacillus sp. CGMCC 1.16607 TaxID=3351842 RepID=UPI003643C8BD
MKWKKRAILSLTFWLMGIMALIGRLIQVQLFATEDFTKHHINLIEASVKQRSQEMIVDNGRGDFLDRNGEFLTHEKLPVLILFPFLSKMEWNINTVADILDMSKYSLIKEIEKNDKPFALGDPDPILLSKEQMEKINDLHIPGVFAVEKKYSIADYPAEQLIGIIRENPNELIKRYPDKKLSTQTLIGVSGMEESFDEFLLAEGKSKLVYHVDGDGSPLFGINVKYVDPGNSFYPLNIRTTIDRQLQTEAEKLVDKYGIKKGGLVLLDIQENSILAMVSRPNINQKDPYNGLGMHNMMVEQQIIGSVFKTVVAAAAIDYKLDDPKRLFDCNVINGKPDLQYQHGMLNFTNSFARSCNNTFGTIARELKDIDPNLLEDYANRLGMNSKVGWEGNIYHFEQFSQLKDEEKGRIFTTEDAKKDKNFVYYSGIGQHEVRATPLAVANMMATIARGGKKEMVRVASKIEYKNGTTMAEFDKKIIPGETIAPYTAMKLQKLLREVVINEHGTGRWFQELPYEVAGKSGTAQTGVINDGEELHNKWFAGYFPYKNPRYALVAVNLGVPSNEGGVNPLFADMVNAIFPYENKSQNDGT